MPDGPHVWFLWELVEGETLQERIQHGAIPLTVFGLPVRVASVDDLIRMKVATGRPKDNEHAMQLRALKKIVDEGKSE